jgi:hypothetical protein
VRQSEFSGTQACIICSALDGDFEDHTAVAGLMVSTILRL